jgi:tetratricopeptide (TPR) repeat protein
MLRLDEYHGLPAVALLAVFSGASLVLMAQAPAVAQSPAAASQTPSAVAAPQPPPTPEDLGDSLAARQRYQAAIEAYDKIPQKSADVWNKMGIAYQMMFNSKNAIHCYKESLRLDPQNALVMNNLGTVYDSLKEYKAGERLYRRALKIDPRSASILQNLGTNLLSQHKDSQGWDAYKEALAIDPNIFENRNGPRVQNPGSVEQRGAMNYYMARACAVANLTDCALQYLRMALDEGFTTPGKVSADADFSNLRDNPGFKQLLAEERKH